jgi:hypothetical protein
MSGTLVAVGDARDDTNAAFFARLGMRAMAGAVKAELEAAE